MPFAVGENIGPYRILEQLGQGGMATVYKAYHAALDRYVALKVLHPAFTEDPNFEARFQREARLVAKLEHPNIVPIYDYAELENRPYLVMKFIEGETLKARLGRGPLTAEEISQVIDSVGLGLAYAHTQGILHRDIKPSNVLISSDGHMYLADFGLARIAQAGESTLSSDSIMGTPQYISPEQARGDKDLDKGTDIYSLAVMLYEMVVGQVPFNADTPFSIIHDHIFTPLPLPRKINKKVPKGVERVLLKALAKERKDRYPDVLSLVNAFKSAWAEAGVPMQGTALTLPKQTKVASKPPVSKDGKTVVAKDPKKKRSPWLYVAAGVLIMVCCLFVFLVTRDGESGPFSEQGPTPTQVAEVPPVDEPAPTKPAPPKPADDPPAVQDAMRKAEENPQDPYAHLELSLAYWDAGRQRPAYETLSAAADLAGMDSDFFIDAGDEMRTREAWIGSTAMYLRAIKILLPSDDVPEEVFVNFHESVYKAAPMKEVEATYPLLDEIMKVDQPIGLVAQARHAYYGGNLDDGRVFLNQVKRLKPGMYEVSLLEAEFAVIENRFDEAELILLPLTSDLGTPEWIRFLAEDLLNRIP